MTRHPPDSTKVPWWEAADGKKSRPMTRQFRSDNPRRLQLLRDQNPVGKNGIDFVEITTLDQRSLRIVCVLSLIHISEPTRPY